MARPTVEVGRGVKIFRAPTFGREDARCINVDNVTGIINARTVKEPKTYRDIPYSDEAPADAAIYWTELPIDYEPGSGGH